MTTATRMIFSDPLRKGVQQAMLNVTLECNTCRRDLSGNRCPGIVDLPTQKAYCGGDCYAVRPVTLTQMRRG